MFFSPSLITLLDKTISEEKLKLKISTTYNSIHKTLGEKIISITYKPNSNPDDVQQPKNDCFHDLDQSSNSDSQSQCQEYVKKSFHINNNKNLINPILIYSLFGICLMILMLPHEENIESYLNIFQVSVNIKLVVSI